MNTHEDTFAGQLTTRRRKERVFSVVCWLSTWFGLAVLVVLLAGIFWQAAGHLNLGLLTHYDSRFPEQAGILAGIWGSFWVILLTSAISIPIGVGAALYLEEFAGETRLTRLIQVNLANLAGVPSIVYGMLGLTVFVRMFGLFGSQSKRVVISLLFVDLQIPLPFGRSVIAGALTLSLLILPVIIVAAQEALRAVPASIRHASFALGATHWQTVRNQVLPAALPGILTGVILSVSRAIGETAPLIMIGALTYVAFTPGDIAGPMDIFRNPQGVLDAPFDTFTALPILIFNLVSRPNVKYQQVAAAGILVLLIVLLCLNAAAVLIRHRSQKRLRW